VVAATDPTVRAKTMSYPINIEGEFHAAVCVGVDVDGVARDLVGLVWHNTIYTNTEGMGIDIGAWASMRAVRTATVKAVEEAVA